MFDHQNINQFTFVFDMRNTLLHKCVGKKLLFAVLFFASTLPKVGMAQQSFFSYDNRTFFEADMRLGKYFPFEERHAYMKVLPQYLHESAAAIWP